MKFQSVTMKVAKSKEQHALYDFWKLEAELERAKGILTFQREQGIAEKYCKQTEKTIARLQKKYDEAIAEAE